VETNRLWARTVAPIHPEWAERAGAHLVSRSYGDPVWEASRGSAVVQERVTLFGLPIVTRRIGFDRIDGRRSREMFIRHALVRGEWTTHQAFVEANREVIASVEALAERSRRAALVDEPTLYGFFDALGRRDRKDTFQRLDRILSGRALRAGDRELKGDDPLRAFFGMFVSEVRRLLIVRARCDETRTRIDPSISYGEYQARVHARLAAPVEPFSASLFEGNPFLWYKCYQRAGKFSIADLEGALIACADADDTTKDSAPLPETLAALVGTLVSEGR
jgi:hypothetical protein